MEVDIAGSREGEFVCDSNEVLEFKLVPIFLQHFHLRQFCSTLKTFGTSFTYMFVIEILCYNGVDGFNSKAGLHTNKDNGCLTIALIAYPKRFSLWPQEHWFEQSLGIRRGDCLRQPLIFLKHFVQFKALSPKPKFKGLRILKLKAKLHSVALLDGPLQLVQ
ncbi:hypothetical protein J6590_018013 [Homalodisca vitripennis]|nr:hypothetical protein J6590_018013 [Homalodisca vitripennis]